MKILHNKRESRTRDSKKDFHRRKEMTNQGGDWSKMAQVTDIAGWKMRTP